MYCSTSKYSHKEVNDKRNMHINYCKLIHECPESTPARCSTASATFIRLLSPRCGPIICIPMCLLVSYFLTTPAGTLLHRKTNYLKVRNFETSFSFSTYLIAGRPQRFTGTVIRSFISISPKSGRLSNSYGKTGEVGPTKHEIPFSAKHFVNS